LHPSQGQQKVFFHTIIYFTIFDAYHFRYLEHIWLKTTSLKSSQSDSLKDSRKPLGQNLLEGMTPRKRGLFADYRSKWRQGWSNFALL